MVADFSKKRNKEIIKKRYLFQGLGILFIFLVFFLIVADVKIYQKKEQLKEQIEIYKKQIEYIKKSNEVLKEEIANFDNKDYLEKLGYEQLSQARFGETEYMFIKSDQNVEKSIFQENKKTFLGKIYFIFREALNWIKNKF
jgi:cell division protein FtsB